MYKFFLLNFLLLFTLFACKSTKIEESKIFPVLDLYNDGKNFLKKRDYKEAAEKFGEIYFQHSGSEVTPYAELMESYSLFLAKEFDEAIDILENFIKLHPMHEDISYAYYLRALCYYNQIENISHAQEITEKSKLALEDVVKRFNTTQYFKDSKFKLNIVDNYLAGHHMYVGRYYLIADKNPIAAISRFNEIAKNYKDTLYAPEAFYRLAESYSVLGLNSEAQNYANILITNFSKSEWTNYVRKLSYINRN